MNTFSFPFHTVVTMVGPSNCGKSTLVKSLSSHLKTLHPKLNFPIVSSDEIRRSIIGQDLHKHNDSMLYVSGQAFNRLFNELENYLQFPASLYNPVIFVDTTGLDERFRKQILDLCKRYEYNTSCIVFDYKNRADFFKFSDENSNTTVTEKHIKKLKTKVLPSLVSKDYSAGIFRIQEPLDSFTVQLENFPYTLDSNNDYVIIGDIHGEFNYFCEILEEFAIKVDKNLFTVTPNSPNKKVILLGDLIDKGPNSLEVVKLVVNNPEVFRVCWGNHENFVFKYLIGEISKVSEDVLEFFDSKEIFKKAENFKLLERLYEMSRPFWIHENFVCFHSPCELKYIGKLSNKAYTNQVKNRYPRDSEELLGFLSFLKDYSFNGINIFTGHISVNEIHKFGAWSFLDTGAGQGGKLSAVLFSKDYKRVVLTSSVGSSDYKFNTISFREVYEEFAEIDSFSKKRIRSLIKNNVQYLAGTMSPADLQDNTLESLPAAMQYYSRKGVNKVVIQPKYMGSNISLYLYRDSSVQDYAITRGGFRLKEERIEGLDSLLASWNNIVFNQFPDSSFVLLQGELMPWAALGSGLIEKDFLVISKTAARELEILKDLGFSDRVKEFTSLENYQNFLGELEVPKEDLKNKYGQSWERWFRNFHEYSLFSVDLEAQEANLQKYLHQLNLYGQPGSLIFECFQVMKVDDRVLPFNNYDGFNIFNSNKCYCLESSNLELADQVYDVLVDNNSLEGVVVKPLETDQEKVVPYIKVRNPEYLRLVYGINYTEDYEYRRILKSKRLGRKLATSLKEWKIARQLLQNPDEKNKIKLFMDFLLEESKEKELDPRL